MKESVAVSNDIFIPILADKSPDYQNAPYAPNLMNQYMKKGFKKGTGRSGQTNWTDPWAAADESASGFNAEYSDAPH